MSEHLNQSALLHRKIREILLKEWDPIGVRDIPEAQDEYDSYIAKIHNLLSSEKPLLEIFNYLWWLETEHMGLPGNKKRTEIFAKKLWTLTEKNK
jgi:hypothetical protein